jgi:hypothetical protein
MEVMLWVTRGGVREIAQGRAPEAYHISVSRLDLQMEKEGWKSLQPVTINNFPLREECIPGVIAEIDARIQEIRLKAEGSVQALEDEKQKILSIGWEGA